MPDPFAVTPGRPRRYGGYAHFPGTGPQGKTCKTCVFKRTKPQSTKLYCKKWIELMLPNGRVANAIEPSSPACKYYEEDRKNRTPYAAARRW